MSKENVKTLAVVGETALSTVPPIPEEDNDGMDNVGSSRRLPQLKVCQNNNPEKDPDSKYYIEGLQEGDLCLTRLRLNLKNEPVLFNVAYIDKFATVPEIVDGQRTGKVLEVLPFDHPRARFGPNGEKPTADNTFIFYVVLQKYGVPATIKMTITKVPVAEEMEEQIKLFKGLSKPLFKLSVAKETNAKNQKFYNFRVVSVGAAPADLYWAAKKVYAKVTEGKLVHDAEEEGEVVDGQSIPF